jgi:hypothetical protein
MRQAIRHRDDLVDLLLIFHDGDLYLCVLEHVGHLLGHRVLVDGHRDCAEALHGGEGGIEAWAIVADDGDRVAALKIEFAQADRERSTCASKRAQLQVCQMPKSLWRMAGRCPCTRALKRRSLGGVSRASS